MQGRTPEATAILDSVNLAFAKLLPMKAASRETNSGFVTPGQLRRATNKLDHTPTESGLAARDILPDSIPDSGTAGRLALGSMLKPSSVTTTAAAGAAAGLGWPAALAAAAAGMYTKTGAKYLSSGGEDILNAVLKKLRQGPMTPANLNQLEEITRLLGSTGTKAVGNIGE